MRYAWLLLSLAVALHAQSPAGRWLSNLKFYDQDNYDRMVLTLNGSRLTGDIGGEHFEGTFRDGRIDGVLKSSDGTTLLLEARYTGDRIVGKGIEKPRNLEVHWEAQREVPPGAPGRHVFEPTEFHHSFSSALKPALHISPGDTVETWTLDASGIDAKGVRHTSGGDPLTGPFFIEGAVPGDTLVVRFTRIRLNRDTAISAGSITDRALSGSYIERRTPVEGYRPEWKLDRASGYAMLQQPTQALKAYRVPLAPMLGCVGVAPPGDVQYRSGDLGSYGGNLDYNLLREGVTVYLPVHVLGALLFVGDGHAAQGAGELTGDALETSMDIEFTVDLERGVSPSAPRMENDTFLMASGIEGSLDDALRSATSNMARWLERKYGLNAAETASVLGTAMIYDVAEIVDPHVHVVARVPKSLLTGLTEKR